MRLASGIDGVDDILGGGLTPHRMYLVEGAPGAGKTTLALQFLLKGAEVGEVGLYITLSETKSELVAVADSHGWDVSSSRSSSFYPTKASTRDTNKPCCTRRKSNWAKPCATSSSRWTNSNRRASCFDSLSELRLLSQNPLRYRRQILALKRYFATRACTVLLLDDNTSEPGDLQLHSIAHGVISLDNLAHDYGGERRRLRIAKMRGIKFREGYHDMTLDTGGIKVYPRLVAAEHHSDFSGQVLSTGTEGLDALLGGGLVPGTNALMIGPSGVGKTTTVVSCLLAALERGEPCVYYLFDETLTTLLMRCANARHGSGAAHRERPADASPDRSRRNIAGRIRQRRAQPVEKERRSMSRSTVSTPISRRCPANAICCCKCMNCSAI